MIKKIMLCIMIFSSSFLLHAQQGDFDIPVIVPKVNKKMMKSINKKLRSSFYYNNKRIKKVPDFIKVPFRSKYSNLNGVITFRGNNLRNGGGYGTLNLKSGKLSTAWRKIVKEDPKWGGGAGWTGQPVLIKWPENLKKHMNIKPYFKNKADFVEVIYGSLNGHIYFLDFKTGKESRKPIYLGNSIKGSVSIDPRGYPLLYVGEGIPTKRKQQFKIFNLINQKQLFSTIKDRLAPRGWSGFDSSPIVNPDSDMVVVAGENGVIYFIKLNSQFNEVSGDMKIKPQVYKYIIRYKKKTKLGYEASLSAYKNLLYFADNSGFLHCIDLRNLKHVWLLDFKDDMDASPVIDFENGIPYIYIGNEVDKQGPKGMAMLRKVHGLSGKIMWERKFPCASIPDHNGGFLGTPYIPQGKNSNFIVVSFSHYKHFSHGATLAINKKNGRTKWERKLYMHSWSSPLGMYTAKGDLYLVQADSSGHVSLIRGKDGKKIHSIFLRKTIEATPVFYDNAIIVADRGKSFYRINIH